MELPKLRNAFTTLWIALGVANAAGATTLQDRIDERLGKLRGEMIEVFRDLHRHPELSGQEVRTAGIVAERLRSLGFDVRAGVGGHGVVGVLRGGKPGRIVGFRADMDAIASTAPDPVEYRSEVPGVRHICGHDLHTTVGLAIAEVLAAIRTELPGTAVLIFQPAEETASGAKAMLEGGALEGLALDAVLAFHTAPLPVGTVGSTPGLLLPPTTIAVATLEGEGDLEAFAQALVPRLQALNVVVPLEDTSGGLGGIPLSRDFLVVQPFRAAAGPGPAEYTLHIMLRASGDNRLAEGKAKLEEAFDELSTVEAKAAVEFHPESTAGADNDPELVRAVDVILHRALGAENVIQMAGAVPFFSEDFGHFQRLAPGAMYWLGVANTETGSRGLPHAPDFVADDEAIFVGARAMTAVLLELLQSSD